MDEAQVFTLTLFNAGLGIVVGLLVLAVLVSALFDIAKDIRGRLRGKRAAKAARASEGSPWTASAVHGWRPSRAE